MNDGVLLLENCGLVFLDMPQLSADHAKDRGRRRKRQEHVPNRESIFMYCLPTIISDVLYRSKRTARSPISAEFLYIRVSFSRMYRGFVLW